MKPLTLLTLVCLLMLGGTMTAQKKGSKSWIIIESIKKDKTLGKSFKEKATNMAYIDDSLLYLKSEINMSSFKERLFSFEKAVNNGAGKEVIKPKHVAQAKSKHPGKSQDAMKSRLRMYVLQMERVFEDE